MWVTVEAELTLNVGRKTFQNGLVLGCDVAHYESNLLVGTLELARLASCRICQHLIELCNELLDGRDELNQAFGNDNSTEVVAVGSTVGNSLSDVSNNIVERHLLSLYLLADEADIGLALQSALQSDVRSRTTHHLDEVPVLAGRVTVALNVTNQLRVGLTSGVETERGLNLLVLQVTVDGLRATDYLHTVLLGSIVFSQHASVGVRVVTTNDNESLDAQLAQNLDTALELCFLLQLCTTGTNDVETTSVAILVDELIGEFHILVVNQTARSHKETVELRVLVQRLNTVVETADDIVTARSLTTREDDTYVDGFLVLALSRNELNNRHSVSVGEQSLNLFLITYTLCGCALLNLYRTLKSFWQLWLISSPCNLQCTFFHNINVNLEYIVS